MCLSERPLIDEIQIREAVMRIGEEIGARHRGAEDLVLVVVLKGGAVFASDLIRCIDLPLSLEYVRAKSYDGTRSVGDVQLTLMPDRPLEGKRLIVVEDILDTGRTTTAILHALAQQDPASLELCVLLDKPARRIVPVKPQYVGFTIANRFVVGYGLDLDERYRNLRAVYTLEKKRG